MMRTLLATMLIRLGVWLLHEDDREEVLWIMAHSRDGVI